MARKSSRRTAESYLVGRSPVRNSSRSIQARFTDIVRSGFGGAPGVVLRREDGTISVEDDHEVRLVENPPANLCVVR